MSLLAEVVHETGKGEDGQGDHSGDDDPVGSNGGGLVQLLNQIPGINFMGTQSLSCSRAEARAVWSTSGKRLETFHCH